MWDTIVIVVPLIVASAFFGKWAFDRKKAADAAAAEAAEMASYKELLAALYTAAETDAVMTEEDLVGFGAIEGNPRIYLGAGGFVFDVSAKSEFYGHEGPYAGFAGRDASVALGKNEVSWQKLEGVTLDDFVAADYRRLTEWVTFFQKRYPLVALLKSWAPQSSSDANTKKEN